MTVAGKNREFMIRESDFGMKYHTFRHETDTDLATVADQQLKRLRYLKREFRDDIAVGRKIYVIKRSPEVLRAEEMLPIYTALNECGVNWLLWVVTADEHNPAGSVRTLLPGLLRGNVERFAPLDNAPDLNAASWTAVCKAVWKIAGGALAE